MDKNIIKSRLSELSRDDLDLSRLVDITIFGVSRVVLSDKKNNFGVSFQVLEHFNNKPEKTLHSIYRYNEADIYELLSILIRLEKQFDKMRNAYISVEWK